MHEAVGKMIAKYECGTPEDYIHALREILQEITLLGLWRSKFFERAAFYGGTALRILYRMDRFSEDLDFSLLAPDPAFNLKKYFDALEKELNAFGFEVTVSDKEKNITSPVQSAFLKTNTYSQLLTITGNEDLLVGVHPDQKLKIKLEVDTDPPPGFSTEPKYLLQPIPFTAISYVLPDLFAGKMHAVLYRRWKNRVKGRDWYDFVWFVAYHPELHLAHLEQRMRQSGDWSKTGSLTEEEFRELLKATIENLDIESARKEVEPFLKNPDSLQVWSKEFFHDVGSRIQII